MALENNKQMGIMSQKMIQATEERKAAATKRLPSISATGAYLFNSRETSLIAHDMMLPIGSVAPDGSFTFTPDQVNNSFTTIDGQVVPLDASGQPFDPRTNPEKILWKQYTTIPKDQLTFDTRNVFAGAITLAQPVYMGGKIQAYNRIARMAETLSVHQRDAAASQVILSTDQAYWGIVSLTHKKHLAESLARPAREAAEGRRRHETRRGRHPFGRTLGRGAAEPGTDVPHPGRRRADPLQDEPGDDLRAAPRGRFHPLGQHRREPA